MGCPGTRWGEEALALRAQSLADAFRAFDADPDARVGVLYGEGGAFCAGADLKALSEGRMTKGQAREAAEALARQVAAFPRRA